MLDLCLRGGTVLDGTGRPSVRADVAVYEGRVVGIGRFRQRARREIDAAGLMVAPGFVDVHTHYDAQLSWDPAATPSPLHGVTTVIGGNCGFSLAPVAPADAEYLARLMARVEGMPLAALEHLDWSWSSFGEWLDRFEGKIALNAGFLAGHCAIRRSIMGERAVGEEAGEGEVAAMGELLGRCLSEGALGFSTSQARTHHDGDGQPVPSRSASRRELEQLCAVVSPYPGTTLELIVPGCVDGFSEEEVDLLATLSLLANRPANWNVLGVSALNPKAVEHQLQASTVAQQRGATVLALTIPHTMKLRLSFENGAIIDALPGWRELFALEPAERIARLGDPEERRRLDQGARSPEAGIIGGLANWGYLVVDETFSPANRAFEGRTVGSIARELGKEPFDALIDIVIEDRLRTGLRPPIPETEADWELRAKVWRDSRAVVGGSDAGAHLDVMCGAIYSTSLLGEGVRKRQLISWEEAARLLGDVPARLYGLEGRGRIAEGFWADLVVFDPERIGHKPERTRDDLPGGCSRLFAEAEGIEHVIVNGEEIVRAGEVTGATPGHVLRSGQDTYSVPAGSWSLQ